MRARRLGGGLLGCVLAVGLAAGPTAPAGAASSGSAKEWASAVCSATRTWTHDVERAAAKAEKAHANRALTEGPLAALLTYLKSAAGATGMLTSAVRRAGVPDVQGGRGDARTLVRALDGIETTFRDARHDLLTLEKSTDTAAIAAAVAAARTKVEDALTQGLGAVDSVLGGGALGRAAAGVKVCKALSG